MSIKLRWYQYLPDNVQPYLPGIYPTEIPSVIENFKLQYWDEEDNCWNNVPSVIELKPKKED